jgi:hypothetical protein
MIKFLIKNTIKTFLGILKRPEEINRNGTKSRLIDLNVRGIIDYFVYQLKNVKPWM